MSLRVCLGGVWSRPMCKITNYKKRIRELTLNQNYCNDDRQPNLINAPYPIDGKPRSVYQAVIL